MNHRVRPVVSWLLVLAVLLALTGVAQARPGPQSPGPVRVYGRDLALTPKPLRPVAVPPDPVVQAMIDQVSATVVYSYTGDLSGEWPVLVGGAPYTIATRHTNSGTPVAKATQFVGEHLAAQGLDVEYHVWDASRPPNVIGELPGLTNPDDVYIICGHLDDMPSGGLAPGADDNASGSVAVLIAADILTQYQWGCTLRFALWTGEEQGLLGSAAYAARCHDNGENILGVLNLDMIAWNTPSSSPDIDLHAKSTIPATLTLAQLFADVVDAYNLNLVPQIVPNGTGASDHASFWTYGYTAILGIEDGNDFNPRYHTTGDQLQYLDMAYYTDFVKAAIATFVHMSGCLIPGGLGALDGHVTAAGGSVPIVGATVTADDGAGHAYPATTDAAGYYTRTLLADTYTVTASAFGYLPSTVAGVAITTDTVTTQDFALAIAPTHTISGAVTEAGTGTPLYAQVAAADTPLAPAWTDPATGHYALTVPEGTYTLRVSAALRRPAERVVVADHDQVQDFALEPLPCILLVDDDNDAPDVRPYYIAALD
ncbi:MAG: M28 family peptidase, partial [Chloroflexi bacterium]|nr:M28 family peptidase [Chloroflexota bacterium]